VHKLNVGDEGGAGRRANQDNNSLQTEINGWQAPILFSFRGKPNVMTVALAASP
jgi:hypothetical protein